jgi:hypothetical protein
MTVSAGAQSFTGDVLQLTGAGDGNFITAQSTDQTRIFEVSLCV